MTHPNPKVAEYLNNPSKFDDKSTVAAFKSSMERVTKSIKDAGTRGVDPGISSEPAQLIPPPPGYDPFVGKKCLAIGLQKNGLGRPKICGRQAVFVLRSFHAEVPEDRSLKDHVAELNAQFALRAYAGTSGRIYAGSGPKTGHMVSDPSGPISPDDFFVCFWHSISVHKDHLHPDDGYIPEPTPAPEKPLMGLDHLNPARQWRTVGQDGTFVWVSDGLVTVMAFKRDYAAYLAANGTLPEFGQLL